ncbi:hypothetical protein [Serratia fonticola]
MSNYEELIRPEFEVQCKKLGRGIERGTHFGEYASLPTYDAWEELKLAATPLLAALEEKDKTLALVREQRDNELRTNTELEQRLDTEVREWTQKYVNEKSRVEAAGRREEHLKADVAVMGNRIAELERANAAQDDHINQQQDRIDTLEKKNDELGKHIGKQEKLLKGTEESLIASVDMVAELERRLQQPIKLRKCDIGIACEFISEHVVVSLAAVMVEAATAGFKAEVEGE